MLPKFADGLKTWFAGRLRLAPSTANPTGTPPPSVNSERLTPSLPRSVGFGPHFFSAQRRLGHRPIHAQPRPVDSLQRIVFHQACLPDFQEHAGLNPLLKAVVGRGRWTETRRIQGVPLTG